MIVKIPDDETEQKSKSPLKKIKLIQQPKVEMKDSSSQTVKIQIKIPEKQENC